MQPGTKKYHISVEVTFADRFEVLATSEEKAVAFLRKIITRKGNLSKNYHIVGLVPTDIEEEDW